MNRHNDTEILRRELLDEKAIRKANDEEELREIARAYGLK